MWLDTTFKVKRSKVNLQGREGTYCGGLPHSLLTLRTLQDYCTMERAYTRRWDPQEKLDSNSRSAFQDQITQCHRQWHGSIGHLGLPVGDQWYSIGSVSYRVWHIQRFRSQNANVINECRLYFDFMLPSELLVKRKRNFLRKFNSCSSIVCHFGFGNECDNYLFLLVKLIK